MPRRQTNKLKWKAQLMTVNDTVDDNDRPVISREFKRDIYFEDRGVSAQEKFLSMQNKTEVVRKIVCRWDDTVTEKDNGIRIKDIDYNIVRIFVNVKKRKMELSLAYVD